MHGNGNDNGNGHRNNFYVQHHRHISHHNNNNMQNIQNIQNIQNSTSPSPKSRTILSKLNLNLSTIQSNSDSKSITSASQIKNKLY